MFYNKMTGAYLYFERSVVFASIAITAYFVIGCWMYKEWWFGLLWNREFEDPDYVGAALRFLLNERFYLLLGIVVTPFVVGVLIWSFRRPIFAFVDRFGVLLIFSAVTTCLVTALVLYHVNKDLSSWMPDADFKRSLERMEVAMRNIRASTTLPSLYPPVDFYYLEKRRIDALFNQIQSELVEKERTVNTSGNVHGKVSANAGPVSAEAEAGKSTSGTSSFSRTDFSTERKCLDLINYIVENRAPQYYKTRDDWLLRRANADFWIDWQRTRSGPVDYSLIHKIAPLTEKPTQEDEREANRKLQKYETYLTESLKSSKGFVIVDGTFDATVSGDNITLLEHFSAKPKVVFRASLPKVAMTDFLRTTRPQLKLFGDVIKPLGDDGYVDVHPIALY